MEAIEIDAKENHRRSTRVCSIDSRWGKPRSSSHLNQPYDDYKRPKWSKEKDTFLVGQASLRVTEGLR